MLTIRIHNGRGHDLTLAPIYSNLHEKVEQQLVMAYDTDECTYFCLETIDQINEIRKLLDHAEEQLLKSQDHRQD